MRWLIRSALTLLVLIPFILYAIDQEGNNNGFIANMEYLAYDTRVRLNTSKEKDDNVFILDIDEKSMAEIGQWPWPRDKIAELVDVLFDHYEIEVLGFDMTFPEPDRSQDLDVLNELEKKLGAQVSGIDIDFEEMRKSRQRDQIFAESLKDRKIVLGFVLGGYNSEYESAGSMPDPVMPASFLDDDVGVLKLNTHIGNLEILQRAASTAGNFNPVSIDPDGKIRTIPMMVEYDGMIYDSLALAIAKLALGVEEVNFEFENVEQQEGFLGLGIAGRTFPTGDAMKMLVPYRGDAGTFDYFSAVDVLNKKYPKEALDSGILIAGTSAAGLKDIRVTPVGENYPGVEINATMISGMLSETVKHTPEYSDAVLFVALLLSALILTMIMPTLPVLLSTFLTMLMVLGAWLGNLYLWGNNLVLPIAPLILFIASCFITHLIYGSFIESRRKQQLSRLFGQYVPPELVEEMETDLAHFSMEPQEKILTVMFADIRGFTPLSEALTAEQVTELLNEFLTMMTEVIHAKRGTIDKYMGDAIMAFWGAPLPDEDHAQNALEAAFLMQEKMDEVNANLTERGLPNIAMCIGLNTGIMRVGNMGSEFRMAYTVIGDSVNLAARLEALTRNYGVGIMVGEATRKALKETLCIELDKVRVKGKEVPVSVYEPLAFLSDMTSDHSFMLENHRAAVLEYRKQNWDAAESLFSQLVERFPDTELFPIYLKRIANFRQAPPGQDWDGVYRYTTK